ncbi:type III secretion apparatus protein OrgA/MxiK [Burkholderia dolosa]|uniref:type III secretion apparatus protein OrgA/MxiK n=1 Tax=Burkholderia dolosa TaxID=152500 RepID=UPI0015929DD1|nr:type III secretion apparatus protein OrgA/MxiK [Burkholderia dolosa]MBR8458384.1 type III secretion apparatus protein OrgA/MxiK [Burkholderia dolosa]
MAVMYGPISYAHDDYRTIDELDLARLPACLANQQLILHHRLPTGIDPAWLEVPALRRCIDRWSILPRACFLLGARRQRAKLIETGRYARLDTGAQRFLCAPLAASLAVRGPHESSDVAPVLAGLNMLAPLLARLPGALRQRLPLLFPHADRTDIACALNSTSGMYAGRALALLCAVDHDEFLTTNTPPIG